MMKLANIGLRMFLASQLLILPLFSLPDAKAAKLDCSSGGSASNDLPRTAAIATNPAGTGAHALGAGLASVASKVTGIALKVQPYNGPNAWMPLLESGELELGVLNILDSQMAATGTGNYKKPYPMLRVIAGGVFPFTASAMVRDKSDIKQISDLKGKRVAWDYGGHAISQNFLNAVLETGGIRPSDVQQVRVSNVNDGIRAVPEGKVDASWASLGTGTNEEANAMEPVRLLNIPNTEASNKILGRYGGSVVKATPSAGVRGETFVLGYALHIVGSSKLSDRAVTALTKAWWDNLAELQTIHPLFKQWTKENQAISNFTIPYHPGAVKFYKDVGVWTAKQDARTKEICS
jgi:TRAP transporter TAXI family solute receptor